MQYENIDAGRYFIVAAERAGDTADGNAKATESLLTSLLNTSGTDTIRTVGVWDGVSEASFIVHYGPDVDEEPIRQRIRNLAAVYEQEAIVDGGALVLREDHGWRTLPRMVASWEIEPPTDTGYTVLPDGGVLVLR